MISVKEQVESGAVDRLPGMGDLWGGLAGAAVILPQALAFGVALYAPFGMDPARGALAGLIGAALLCGIAGLVGGTRGLISAPTGPALALLSGACVALQAAGVGVDRLAGALVAVLAAAGLFQTVIALTGGGRLIKYIPYPVVSGFMTGSAILMIESQLRPLAGGGMDAAWDGWRWLPALSAIATFATMSFSARILPRLPATISGLLAGTAVFHLVAAFGPDATPSAWLIGTLPDPGAMDLDYSLDRFAGLPLLEVAVAGTALAILASLNTLLASVVADVETGERHDARRALAGQGIAQLFTGVLGGMGGSATTGATVVAIRSGGRRWAGAVGGGVMLLLIVGGRDIGRVLPVGVLAGIILHTAVHLLDRDIVAWIRRPGTRADAGIALLVTGITVVYDLTAAIGLGIAIAIIQFVQTQVRQPVVHRRSTAAQAHSLRKRTTHERKLLDEHGDRIVLYELRGNLFFATADQLLSELLTDLARPAYVILHMQRVNQVDLTAIKIVQQIGARLQAHGGILILCNVHEALGLGRQVQETLRKVSPVASNLRVLTFNGRDESLEFAENALLDGLGDTLTETRREVPLAENDLCKFMDRAEIGLLESVVRTRLVESGQKVFSRDDKGEELFIVASGEVDIRLPTTRHHYKRLTTCGPGTFFGELAFVSPGPRAADAVAMQPTRLLILDREGLRTLIARSPETAVELLMTLGRMQVEHQRWSTAEIQRLSEW